MLARKGRNDDNNNNAKIAILGWGSLIWEPREDFKKYTGSWEDDGPVLPTTYVEKTNDVFNPTKTVEYLENLNSDSWLLPYIADRWVSWLGICSGSLSSPNPYR